MVKTGARAAALGSLLEQAGRELRTSRPPAPRARDLSADQAEELTTLLACLGGNADALDRLRPGAWDLTLADGVLVELDEELHFNRYRLVTLETTWSQDLPWTRAYLDFCASHEAECLRAAQWGRRWTNPSCEMLFGAPATPGDLDGAGGAPRWKQRAIYDAMKDAVAARSAVRLARLSVHDLVGEISLEAALRYPGRADIGALAELIEARTS